MKTDRRHALQTNWLADHLGHWLDKIKPYTNHIITGTFVVVAGLVIWLVVARFWPNHEEETWDRLNDYGSRLQAAIDRNTKDDKAKIDKKRKELRELRPPLDNSQQAKDDHEKKIRELNEEITSLEKERQNKVTEIVQREHEDLYRLAKANIRTVAGRAAAFTVASRDFSEAASSVLTDPVVAREKLDRAAELFKAVKENAKDKLLKQRAQFQLARVYETRLEKDAQHQDQDDIALARREYEDLVNQKPPSYCKLEAERRLAALQPKTKDGTAPKDPVYEWVSDEMAKRKASPLPLGPGSGSIHGEPPPEIE